MDNIREGLARTGHPLVPMVWELDRICDGDAGGYIHWGATTQNITQTGKLLNVRRAHHVFLSQIADLLTLLAALAEETKDAALPGRTHGQHARSPRHTATRCPCGLTNCAAMSSVCADAKAACSWRCSAAAPARWRPLGEIGLQIQDGIAERLGMSSMSNPSPHHRRPSHRVHNHPRAARRHLQQKSAGKSIRR